MKVAIKVERIISDHRYAVYVIYAPTNSRLTLQPYNGQTDAHKKLIYSPHLVGRESVFSSHIPSELCRDTVSSMHKKLMFG